MPHIELRCEWHFGNCSIWIMRDQCRFIKREDHRTKHISFSVRNWKDKKCLRPQRTKAKKNIKKSEKALSQADFPENPVIFFSVLRAKIPLEIFGFQEVFLYIRLLRLAKSWEQIKGNLCKIRLTHILTHNGKTSSGQSSIFENLRMGFQRKPEYFETFQKKHFYPMGQRY